MLLCKDYHLIFGICYFRQGLVVFGGPMFGIKFIVYSRWRRDYSHSMSTSSLQMRTLRCPNFLSPLASSHAALIVARYYTAFALELPKTFDATAKYCFSRIGAVFFIMLLNAFAPK